MYPSSFDDHHQLLQNKNADMIFQEHVFDHRDGQIDERVLAKAPNPVDYTVVSVGVMTLGLLLLVELIRHQLDLTAKNRPFFKTVLEGVYSELATLGFVEFFIFLLHTYYKNLNVPRELVFANVHFTLFYTAILNAFQSVVLALCARRVSTQLWVRTEELDLDHYVEIREEFERIRAKWYDRFKDDIDDTERMSVAPADDTDGGCYEWLRKILPITLLHPSLRAKYMKLLIQVRFHQLRLHFLEEHELPLHFKVSDYLKRSERTVLQHLVHVSPSAWLFLTGGLNLIYFLMGMVAYVSEEVFVVGQSLTWIFFSSMIIFIFASIIVYYKMKKVFRRIINMKRHNFKESHQEGVKEQLSFFWGGDPELVIAIIQFMQFGYALSLSMVIIFWDDFDGDVAHYYYIIAVLVCYSMFLYVMAQVLPQYTLCTSLGHLYNERHLHETLASYRLEEARKQRKRLLAERDIANFRETNSMMIFGNSMGEEDTNSLGATTASSVQGNSANNTSNQIQLVPSFSTSMTADSTSSASNSINEAATDKRAMLAALVKSDTKSLRAVLPQESRNVLSKREQMRSANKRSLSDGVGMMQTMSVRNITNSMLATAGNLTSKEGSENKTSEAGVPGHSVDDLGLIKRKDRRKQRRKVLSSSATIQSWRNLSEAEHDAGDIFRDGQTHTNATSNGTKIVDHVPPEASAIKVLELEDQIDGSVGALSDVDDSSMTDESEGKTAGQHDVNHKPLSLRQKLKIYTSLKSLAQYWKRFLLSDLYPTVSHVFGTLVCFFLVGHRVEAFLTLSYVVEESANTWNLRLFVGFWWEVTWLVLILIDASLILVLFVPNSARKLEPHDSASRSDMRRKEKFLVVCAAVDILVTGACLALLVLAESERCCDIDDYEGTPEDVYTGYGDSNYRRLAGEYSSKSEAGYINKYLESTNYSCCPRWGERKYGGLGTIEPFTSLIALRVLRFAISSFIMGCLEHGQNRKNNTQSPETPDSTQKSSKKDIAGDNWTEQPTLASTSHSCHGVTRDSMCEESGTALELWERAIGKYPDIVAKYGEFSGELFQAMLGLEIIEKSGHEIASFEKRATIQRAAIVPSAQDNQGRNGGQEDDTQHAAAAESPHICLSGKQYVNLPPDAQGIIIAGKLGKPVKSFLPPSSRTGSFGSLPTLAEVHEHDDEERRVSTVSQHRESPIQKAQSCKRKSSVEFVVDNEKLALESQDKFDMFVAPGARLVRAMRRCDRRLLPLLNKWATVDVVMTKFEIVYFEATDKEDDDAMKSALLALKATKGGKGLRLGDVAKGRKIVGHLEISDITELHVERDEPLEDQTSLEDLEKHDPGQKDDDNQALLYTEYWLHPVSESDMPNDQKTRPSRQWERNSRWAKIEEDRLKLVSHHGTLMLRFYSDLENAETSKVSGNDGSIVKDISLQWAQTIARSCGRGQLKQDLPHFGDNTSEELRDYLEVVHFHEKEIDKKAHVRKKRNSLLPEF